MVASGAAPAIAVAAVRGGRVSFLDASGRSDLATGQAATPETAFLWFSVTKVVTATAVMQLAERGLVDLDRPVRAVLPAFEVENPYGGEVTVRHLLSHTAGLAKGVAGTVRFSTIAGNRAQFGAGIVGLGGLAISDTIVSNAALNAYVNANCYDFASAQATGAGLLQWSPGGRDDACAPGATFADPLLGALGMNGGPTETMVPGPSSPALGQGQACPAADQRGVPRPAGGCDLGAVEVP